MDFQTFKLPSMSLFFNSIKNRHISANLDFFSFDLNLGKYFNKNNFRLLYFIWEMLLLNKSLVVFGDSPSSVGNVIHILKSLIFPIQIEKNKIIPYLSFVDERAKDIVREGFQN